MTISRLSVVIPAYNEEKTIETLIRRVEDVDLGPVEKEIVIVDDGSRDGTARILEAYRDRHVVLTHAVNRGKGAAVRTGFANASGDYVVVQDADLEYDPNDYLSMLDVARRNDAMVVYGSRQLPIGGKRNKPGRWYFFWGGIFLTHLTNLLYGTRITDEPTCYKMMHKSVLERLTLTADGFEFCPEITAKIARLGIPIHETAIHYTPRSAAEGKKIRSKDGLIAIWTLIRHRF